MADDLLKDLLTSPLEDAAEERRRRRRGRSEANDTGTGITPDGQGEDGRRAPFDRVPLLWGLGAAVVGALIVVAGYSVASDDAAPTTTTAATTTTTTLPAADGSPAGLPEGYVAVGDRLGMRVERVLVREDGVFLTVTTVVENSFDPAGSTGFQGGLWTLVLADGRRITSTVESFDALARGTVSIWFPPDGIVADDIVALELNGTATRLTNTFSTESVEVVELGDAEAGVGITPARFDIDAGVTLVIDELTLSTATGSMSWSLGGEAVSNAAVTPTLTVFDASDTPTIVPTQAQTSAFILFHPSVAGPILTPDGVVGFRMSESESLPSGEELRAVLDIQVTWATYEPVVVSLPVEGAAIAEVR